MYWHCLLGLFFSRLLSNQKRPVAHATGSGHDFIQVDGSNNVIPLCSLTSGRIRSYYNWLHPLKEAYRAQCQIHRRTIFAMVFNFESVFLLLRFLVISYPYSGQSMQRRRNLKKLYFNGRPTVHTHLSRKQNFSKTFFKRRNLKTPALL